MWFLGSELELTVNQVIARGQLPEVCSAKDPRGRDWLVVQADSAPWHLSWVCAEVSERAVRAVVADVDRAWDAVRHSRTGTVELVVVENGHTVPDRCLLCGCLPVTTPRPSHSNLLTAA